MARVAPGSRRDGRIWMIPFEAESASVALVRRAFEAFARRDLPALTELTDPEVELYAPTAALAHEGRCYRGHDGLARYLLDVQRIWSKLEVLPERFREVGSHVVALGSVHGEARDGMTVESTVAWVWEVRDGKLAWACVYAEPGETFMGLSLGDDSRAAADEPGVTGVTRQPPARAA